ncbi:tripartite tricarboxylate transporter substrate binding protein [Oleispirillum naphthae]|uniref:Bug family tripartite tricarboxylate transporter substrate binding protein n=1 Tax=Oleispirillum naphthae TaxID=2838853 RepID=UPI0030824C5E
MALLPLTLPAAAEAKFPNAPVTLIVPYSPGGSTDIIARGLAEPFQKITGQPLVIVNKSGGGSAVGLTEALTYKPDGYTLVLVPSAFAVASKLGMVKFDQTAFDHIANITSEPLCFVVKASSPWKDMRDVVAFAKANPGVVTIGVGGAGTLAHMTALGIEKRGNIKMTVVPFGGNALAKTAMLGGHVSIASMHPSEFVSQMKAKQVRVLGAVTDTRSPDIPDVPTFKEQGIDFAWDDSRWIAAPKGLAADVKAELVAIFKKAAAAQSFKDHTDKMKITIDFRSGAALDKQIGVLFSEMAEIAKEAQK